MTPTDHAREGDLLWDYPERTHPIVGILAIAACFGIGATLVRAGDFDQLLFVASLGFAFLVALTDVGYFFRRRVPPRPRVLSD